MASTIKVDTIQSTTSNVFIQNSTGTEYARFDSSGNLGIGTSSPNTNSKLDVAGISQSSSASYPAFQLYNSGLASNAYFRIAYDAANNLVFNSVNNAYNSSTEYMRINSSGNVGIGTSSPSYPLHVQTSNATNPAGYFYNTSGSSNSPALIARGGANNSNAARIISAQDYDGNEEFGISGTGELRVNAGYGSSALGFVCRAWVNFDGTGTVAIRASGNVSSITDVGVGTYTVNLTTAMPDTNYACAMAVRGSSGAGTAVVAIEHAGLAARTTTSVSLYAIALNSATPDTNLIEVMFFR